MDKFTSIGLAVLCLLLTECIYSQQQVYRTYNTQEYYKTGQAGTNSSYPENLVESHFQDFKRNPDIKGVNIHLIFHVLYSDPSQQVTQGAIQAQIDQLNLDFGQNSWDNTHVGDPYGNYKNTLSTNPEFRFCLVSQSFLTSGEIVAEPINYVMTRGITWDIDNSMKYASSNGSNAILTDYLVNIWVCDLKGNHNAGFAQRPGGDPGTDGIVIDYQYMMGHGQTHLEYNLGKTLTHLMANYLNLHDLWGENCMDDKVSDTPIHNAANFGCPEYAHVTLCDNSFVTEMSMNFLDNTNDACQYMFTNGQKVRMHATVSEGGPRFNLRVPGDCEEQNRTIELDDLLNNSNDAELSESEFQIYPNPTSGEIIVQTPIIEGNYILEVISTDGQILMNRQFQNGINQSIDLSKDLLPGLYFLKISDSSQSRSFQIVLQ